MQCAVFIWAVVSRRFVVHSRYSADILVQTSWRRSSLAGAAKNYFWGGVSDKGGFLYMLLLVWLCVWARERERERSIEKKAAQAKHRVERIVKSAKYEVSSWSFQFVRAYVYMCVCVYLGLAINGSTCASWYNCATTPPSVLCVCDHTASC